MGELMAAKKKKMAAALAAVDLYLQQEEAAAQEQQALVHQTRAPFSPWAHSGRQDIMAMRRLIQMRAFTRF